MEYLGGFVFIVLGIYSAVAAVLDLDENFGSLAFKLECLRYFEGCQIREIYHSYRTPKEKYKDAQDLYKFIEEQKQKIHKADWERPGIHTMGW